MKWELEALSSPAYLSNSNCLLEESKSSKWTPEENKMFENALSVYDTDTADRWQKVAAMIPGKTAEDVLKQYKELELDVGKIEAGLVPIPGYSTSPFTLEWSSNHGYQGLKQSSYGLGGGKRPPPTRPTDQERKKGVPWTEEEHKLFLLGLKKYGKGDWRNISRNFVITRTPTQVASHAQKYFIRQLSGGKDKRRASIHDITTVNLTDSQTPSPENKRPPSPDRSAGPPNPPNSAPMNRTTFQWCQPSNGAPLAFNPTHGNLFMSSPYGMNSYGFKMQGQNLHRAAFNESYIAPQNMDFQMQSAQHFPHG